MWLCADLSARVQVRGRVGTCARSWRHDLGLGGQPCREPMVAVPLGSPWEKNSLTPGIPLKSPQSPQVWLAYLVSSSSWNEMTCQMPGPPGSPRMEGQRTCGRATPRGGWGFSGSALTWKGRPGARPLPAFPVTLTQNTPSLTMHHVWPLERPSPTGGSPHLPQTHQEAVILVPHEDEAQPGHHLQVAAAALNEDPRLAEGQLDSAERGG